MKKILPENLTIGAVVGYVDYIRSIADDDEGAHVAEDFLRERVLEAVANGHEDSKLLAAAALDTNDIEFSRWCA